MVDQPIGVKPASGSRSRAGRVLVALPVVVLLIVLLAVGLGSADLPAALAWQLRAPRVLAAAGVGALLALSGLAMQVVLRNPLADPYVLGTSGGAAVGALLALMLGCSLGLGAAVGALVVTALLLALARRALTQADDASARLILVGAMLAAVTGALGTLLLTLTPDPQLRGAIFWLVGDLSGARGGLGCLLLAAGLAALLIWRARSVDRLLLGSEAAALLGEPVVVLRWGLLAGASLAAGWAVATAGSIGFVGLVVPHVLRLGGVQRTRDLAWAAPIGGATLLVAADLLARTVAAPQELPVGAVMALLGAPLFIAFLLRGAR
ncbi:FecCD family ABC transporter permease [Aquabacterium sp.]|uniref:FecCD family ABC transporter permease n=1 Tax=Aquabacterium sp. TaxID=1872578 RepID=UPI0035B422DE